MQHAGILLIRWRRCHFVLFCLSPARGVHALARWIPFILSLFLVGACVQVA